MVDSNIEQLVECGANGRYTDIPFPYPITMIDNENQVSREVPADNITNISDTNPNGVTIAVTRSHPSFRTEESRNYYGTRRHGEPELTEQNPWKELRDGLSIITGMKGNRLITGLSIADYKLGIVREEGGHRLDVLFEASTDPNATYGFSDTEADKYELLRDSMNHLPNHLVPEDIIKGGTLHTAERLAQQLRPNEKRFIIDQLRSERNFEQISRPENRMVAGMMYAYKMAIAELSEAYLVNLEDYMSSQGQTFLPGFSEKKRLISNTLGILFAELIKHRVLQRNDIMFRNDNTSSAGIADMMHQMHREDIKAHHNDMGYRHTRSTDLTRQTQAQLTSRTGIFWSSELPWYAPGTIEFSTLIAQHIQNNNYGSNPTPEQKREIAEKTHQCVKQIADFQNTISSLTYRREDTGETEESKFTGADVHLRTNGKEHIQALLAFLNGILFTDNQQPFRH